MNLLVAMVLSAAPLTTLGEQSGFTKTGRYEEVERLCAAFPKAYPGKVKCERFGTTPEGRAMWALIAGAKNRPVVLIQGGIHAGEIDGKDAGFWLLRELLDGKIAKGALERLTLVFVPVFNVDGHERFGPNQRPNQTGPEEMGWRVTSQNLNLNRDYMKADAPEMVAMLGLLRRFDPIMYVDLHVTDGAKFQHDVAICFEPQRAGSASLNAWGRTLRSALMTKLESQGHLPLGFYPAFDDSDDPQSGFSDGWPPPRFGNAYWALHHRFGVLVETHSWKPYAQRVKATFDTCAGLLEEAALHGAEWMEAAKAADAESSKRGATDVVMTWDVKKPGEPFDFQGYAYTRTKSDVSGKFWVQYDERTPQVWKVAVRDEAVPATTMRAPKAGYVIAAAQAAVLRPRLEAHGVKFTVLKHALPKLAVEHLVGEVAFPGGSYEGRLAVTVKGSWVAATEDLAPGSLFVPIAQSQAELVMHLLEPTAPDSFAAWGFFNAYFEQKEYLEDYLTEAFAREQLKDPKVKAAFDEKLKDAAFAKDPEARLNFFAKRHASVDTRIGLMPVYRVDVSPASN